MKNWASRYILRDILKEVVLECFFFPEKPEMCSLMEKGL